MRVYTVEARVSGDLWVEDSAHSTPGQALDRLAEIVEVLPMGNVRLSQRVA